MFKTIKRILNISLYEVTHNTVLHYFLYNTTYFNLKTPIKGIHFRNPEKILLAIGYLSIAYKNYQRKAQNHVNGIYLNKIRGRSLTYRV